MYSFKSVLSEKIFFIIQSISSNISEMIKTLKKIKKNSSNIFLKNIIKNRLNFNRFSIKIKNNTEKNFERTQNFSFSTNSINFDKAKEKKEEIKGIPYTELVIGVPKEIHENEKRVSLIPETVKQLTKLGFKVIVQKNAGIGANFLDSDYTNAGAIITG
jgi:hypothetical protein